MEINSRLAVMSSSQFIVPLRTREEHLVVISDDVGHKIKRLCTLQRMLDKECQTLIAQGEKEASDMKADLCDIVGRILRNEVCRHHPELLRKPFVICSDWTLCWEKTETETRSLALEHAESDDFLRHQAAR
ncbi:hypothetical protein KGQ72_02865 [Patescibacteria group bacterium]|nr:hypothetical protein [Patescibacteria group bacterium]